MGKSILETKSIRTSESNG